MFKLGDLASISESGISPGEGNGNPLQYSCLENPMFKLLMTSFKMLLFLFFFALDKYSQRNVKEHQHKIKLAHKN